MTALGVYAGYDPAAVNDFETWLGEPVDTIGLHAGRLSWADWEGSIADLAATFRDKAPQLAWSIPMFASPGTLRDAAAGLYKNEYVYAAKKLLAASANKEVIFVRTGEEFNLPGGWPWSAHGRPEQFVQAYRNFVDAFRSVSDKFRFEWNVNIGPSGDLNPADAYPGDDYVDIVGMDFYYKLKWDQADTARAWSYQTTRQYGLQWLEDFAAAHGKPTAYSEWGIDSTVGAPYMKGARDWFQGHDVVYQIYWDIDHPNSFQYKLDDARNSKTAQAYDQYFSNLPDKPDAVAAAVTTSLAASQHDLTLTGTANIDGKGNLLNNHLTGNGGRNVLSGGNGTDYLDGRPGLPDTLVGGLGNDTFVLNNTGDKVVEKPGQGTDTVIAGFSYTLPADVENLILRFTGKASGLGNALANHITGNTGDNLLDGMDGQDVLAGGGGNDTFRFSSQYATSTSAPDLITDFSSGDHIDLSLIDANSTVAGNQSFHLGATGGHAGDAVLRYDAGHSRTELLLYINGDATPDATIWLSGLHVGLLSTDFLL